MPNTLGSFFSRQQIPQQPNPEPPGFNLLRDMLMRRAFQLNQNPYGLSPQGQQNAWMMGSRQPFNPYGSFGAQYGMGGVGGGQGGWGGGGMGGPGGAGGLQGLLQMLLQRMGQQGQGGMPGRGAPINVPFRPQIGDGGPPLGGPPPVTTMPMQPQPGGQQRFLPTPVDRGVNTASGGGSPIPSVRYDGTQYDGAELPPTDPAGPAAAQPWMPGGGNPAEAAYLRNTGRAPTTAAMPTGGANPMGFWNNNYGPVGNTGIIGAGHTLARFGQGGQTQVLRDPLTDMRRMGTGTPWPEGTPPAPPGPPPGPPPPAIGGGMRGRIQPGVDASFANSGFQLPGTGPGGVPLPTGGNQQFLPKPPPAPVTTMGGEMARMPMTPFGPTSGTVQGLLGSLGGFQKGVMDQTASPGGTTGSMTPPFTSDFTRQRPTRFPGLG